MEIEIFLKIVLAAALGGIIGLEREMSHKEAGLRTNILIAIGSALITILSIKIAEGSKVADPARLTAQIVTGIGFLGAGAIIQARFAIHGLTTAATIWTVAAIGICVGSGYYLISFLVTVFIVIILITFKYISLTLEKQKKLYIYIIKTEDRASILVEIKKIILELGINYVNINMSKRKSEYEIEILLQVSETKDKEFVGKVMQLKYVKGIVGESL